MPVSAVAAAGRSWVPPKPTYIDGSIEAYIVLANFNDAYTLIGPTVSYTSVIKPSDGEYPETTWTAAVTGYAYSNDKGGAASAYSYFYGISAGTYGNGSKAGQVVDFTFAGYSYHNGGSVAASYWYKIV